MPLDPLAAAPELAVVLGGGLAPDGAPSPATRARAHRAAQLARERPELALIASGDRPPDAPAGTPSEAARMRELIAAAGVDPGRVALEDESRDTLGNAILTAIRHLAPLAPRPLAVITSPFHLERAVQTFRHVLGDRWQLAAVAADETPDDLARGASETRYLQETAAFFRGLAPGDLAGCVARLRARSPHYAALARLAVR